jgi:hypothetical protein
MGDKYPRALAVEEAVMAVDLRPRHLHGRNDDSLPHNMVLTSLNPTGAFGLLGFLLAVTWILVLLRLYVRAFMVRKVSWDDYLILAATVRCSCFPTPPCSGPG